MFKLAIDREIQGANVWVRWCLDAETRKILNKHSERDLRLLLIITGGSIYKEERIIVPLENIVQILPVRYPGRNTIFAAIVWPRGDLRNMEEHLLHRRRGTFISDLINYPTDEEGSPVFSDAYENDIIAISSLEIDVPREVFAEEPPEWEKKWVNRWYEERPRDQCEYRERRIFAYTLQLFFVAIFLCVTAVIFLIYGFFALLFGFYKFSRGPYRFDSSSNLFKIIELEKGARNNWWYNLACALFPGNKERARRRWKEKKRREEEKKAVLAAARIRFYESLACDSGKSPTPPIRHRIYLIFNGVKDKVCKPFAAD